MFQLRSFGDVTGCAVQLVMAQAEASKEGWGNLAWVEAYCVVRFCCWASFWLITLHSFIQQILVERGPCIRYWCGCWVEAGNPETSLLRKMVSVSVLGDKIPQGWEEAPSQAIESYRG